MAIPEEKGSQEISGISRKRRFLHATEHDFRRPSPCPPSATSTTDICKDGGTPKKKNRTAAKPDAVVKRLRRWRDKPPLSYHEIYQRAISQTFYVIDRVRAGSPDCPTENVEIVGTTGNKYDVHIGLEPNCSCPHAKKGNQCKHIVYVLCRTLKAPGELQYQLAFIPSELIRIFENAPPILSDIADEEHRSRKPIEDDCPICCMEFDVQCEEIVYCKASCGNNLHKVCFEQWAISKRAGSATVTCPFCRSPWQGDADSLKHIAKMGKRNAEGYINVAHELGLSGRRDYSTYSPFWVRQQQRLGNIDYDDDDD